MFYNTTRKEMPCEDCRKETNHERKEDHECFAVICLLCHKVEFFPKVVENAAV